MLMKKIRKKKERNKIETSEVTITVLGSGGVYKSSLIVKFIQGIFVEKYDPTIENDYRKCIDLDGQKILLRVLDTAGTEQFTAMRDLYTKESEGFVFVYSVLANSTFRDVEDLVENVLKIKGGSKISESCSGILVGHCIEYAAEARSVTVEQGRALARKWGMSFIEVSSRLDIHVEETFETLTRSVLAHRKKEVYTRLMAVDAINLKEYDFVRNQVISGNIPNFKDDGCSGYLYSICASNDKQLIKYVSARGGIVNSDALLKPLDKDILKAIKLGIKKEVFCTILH